jgi:thiamine-monophosphate kinase
MPRVREALWLAGKTQVHAAIDVSDGLSLDLSRICEASGCGAELDLTAIPIADAAHELARQRNDGSTAIDHALGDGEDFELILAMPPTAASELIARQPLTARLTQIGTFIDQPGLFARGDGKERTTLQARGYEHRLDP